MQKKKHLSHDKIFYIKILEKHEQKDDKQFDSSNCSANRSQFARNLQNNSSWQNAYVPFQMLLQKWSHTIKFPYDNPIVASMHDC